MPKLKVFLCYAREDSKSVEEIYDRLKSEGFIPWMDMKDILPGLQWQNAINRAIRDTHIFLLCLSTNSVNKRGVIQKEITTALEVQAEKLDSDIYIVPVRLQPCDIPSRISHFQVADLYSQKGWEYLLSSLFLQEKVLFGNCDLSENSRHQLNHSVLMRSSTGEEYNLIEGVLPKAEIGLEPAWFGIPTLELIKYARRGQSVQLAQYFTIVKQTLSSPSAVFFGIKRRLDCGDGRDNSTLIYVSRPINDVIFNRSTSLVEYRPAPKGALFIVYVSKVLIDTILVDTTPSTSSAVINRWNWVEEDPSNPNLPINFRDRYNYLIYQSKIEK